MEVTPEMQKWIELVIEESCKRSYPKTGGKHVVGKVKLATLKGLRSRKDDTISLAFRMAMSQRALDDAANANR